MLSWNVKGRWRAMENREADAEWVYVMSALVKSPQIYLVSARLRGWISWVEDRAMARARRSR